jgi:hypothetical protein
MGEPLNCIFECAFVRCQAGVFGGRISAFGPDIEIVGSCVQECRADWGLAVELS